ncbi:MAG: hypothetical protein HN981_03135 [Candidatus Pacebacteria bacterium]|jgi:hypothetical protein|nr:hypothetical protein [Candidatus Paceibacterota bacterium]MBT4652106.1 hypothetical protein [Candidatus Paceibacterota bacterium]MBT6756128.1 hypothetical protein [Candidatus Paceibacterota bacterium]MBT6921362.1 hypothetical protein [Candidatus Paceibacterota bacterium]
MKILKQLFADFFSSVFTIFLVVFSLGQLQRIQLAGNIAFYLHDLIIFLFVSGFLIQQIKLKKNYINNFSNIWKKFRLEILFAGWILLGIIIGFIGGRITTKSILYLVRIIEYSLFIFALHNSKIKYSIYQGLMWAGTAIGFWGLLQYFIIPDVRFLNIFGWDNHYYRLISTIFDPAFTGIILVMTLGLWQRFLIEKNKIKNSSKKINYSQFIFIIQTLLTIAIAATFSRASYLGLVILFFTQWLLQKKKLKWQILFLSGIFISTIFLLPKPGGEGVNLARTSTIKARSDNAQENLVTLRGSQWIWGRGLFNNDAEKESYTNNHAQLPDSLPILLINSTGVVGSFWFLLLLKKWIKKSWKKDSLWTTLLIGVLVHSLFNNTFLQPFVFLMLWGSL